jgi:hypothetical protein
MKNLLRWLSPLIVSLFATAALAQYEEPQSDYPRFSQAELDSMLAPIALYPDSLLSQMLMAATFPRDVAEAAMWSRGNSQVQGQDAVRAVEQEAWDPSVKSLVAFPQVLLMMDEHMEWTERLGDAFMSNPTGVSETIQVLRARADRAGTLRSTEEAVVTRDYGNYVIEPARPEMVYVPYYDPRTAYGEWWWPDYQPVWWAPWPGYAWSAGYSGFAWGYGVFVGPSYWYTSFDWPRRYIRFNSHRPYYWRGYSHSHGHRWNSSDHRRNARNWHWSGYRRDGDGRNVGDGRRTWDGRRGSDGRRDGADRAGDGRGRGGYDGRRDGRRGGDGSGERRVERSPAPTAGVERPLSSRYAPSAPVPGASVAPSTGFERRTRERSYQPAPAQQGQPAAAPQPQRGLERAPERRYVAPQAPSQPLSRGAIGSPAPAPQVQHAPVQRAERAPAPQVHRAPVRESAPSPVAREPRAAPERSQPRAESRPSRPEPRSDSDSGPRGGGNSHGRGGGRSKD